MFDNPFLVAYHLTQLMARWLYSTNAIVKESVILLLIFMVYPLMFGILFNYICLLSEYLQFAVFSRYGWIFGIINNLYSDFLLWDIDFCELLVLPCLTFALWKFYFFIGLGYYKPLFGFVFFFTFVPWAYIYYYSLNFIQFFLVLFFLCYFYLIYFLF